MQRHGCILGWHGRMSWGADGNDDNQAGVGDRWGGCNRLWIGYVVCLSAGERITRNFHSSFWNCMFDKRIEFLCINVF